jgi:hypothetical protein
MMAIPIFLLILLLGGGAIGVVTIVIAIATRKLWLIPAVGAAVLFGLVGLGVIGSIFFKWSSHSMQSAAIEMLPQPPSVASSVSFPTETIVASPPNFAATRGVKINLTWFLIFCVVLGFVVVRSLFGRHHGHGIVRAWPLLVVLGFLALWSLVRVNESYERSRRNRQAAQEAGRAAAAHKQFVRQQNEQRVAKNKIEAAVRHKVLQQRSSIKIGSQKVANVATDDIHELMDQFDQPQIPVLPEAPMPPSPLAPAAAPAAPAPPSMAKADAKKPSTAAGQTRGKSKSPKSDKAKSAAQSVAAPKPNKDVQNKVPHEAKELVEKENQTTAEPVEATRATSGARPAWVDGTKRTGNVPREVIATDEYQTTDECYQAMDVYLMLKTYQRLQQLAGRSYGDGGLPSLTFRNGGIYGDGALMSLGRGDNSWDAPDYRLQSLRNMGLTIDYLRREVVAKDSKTNEPHEYIETLERSFGPMKKLYLQIEFTPATDRELRRYWESHERAERFAVVGLGAGSLLGFLGCIFGLLKIDTWTKGYYTKRLFIGAPLAILGMFGLYVMLVEMGVDLPH